MTSLQLGEQPVGGGRLAPLRLAAPAHPARNLRGQIVAKIQEEARMAIRTGTQGNLWVQGGGGVGYSTRRGRLRSHCRLWSHLTRAITFLSLETLVCSI